MSVSDHRSSREDVISYEVGRPLLRVFSVYRWMVIGVVVSLLVAFSWFVFTWFQPRENAYVIKLEQSFAIERERSADLAAESRARAEQIMRLTGQVKDLQLKVAEMDKELAACRTSQRKTELK